MSPLGKSFPGRRKSKGKGPRTGAAARRNCKEVGVVAPPGTDGEKEDRRSYR